VLNAGGIVAEEYRNTLEKTLSQCYIVHHKSHMYFPGMRFSVDSIKGRF
jgi:hypothetical protein